MAGTVGAIFHSALQCGSAVGLAAMTSIETSVEATHGGPQEYAGRAAAIWFLLGIVTLEFISLSIFYNRSADHKPRHDKPIDAAQHSTQSDKKLDDSNCLVTMPVLNRMDSHVNLSV
ncbi:hypothetical protein AZE42_12130 [Rhizopogon vesiculosus]|uniref:Uncharacterized protein n=1 Tax=Rhizopogon vesiculosus TaxID=180088 RepID=A0A1J8QDA3_9AGAM|nr:hypothetical protein AZE42_12130 [Rhizopogon vesiculosus]